jgi:hypothetical protein
VWLNLPECAFSSPTLTDGYPEERNMLGPKCIDAWLGNQYGSMGGPPGGPQSAHSLAESAAAWEGLAAAGEEIGRNWARIGRLKEPDEVGRPGMQRKAYCVHLDFLDYTAALLTAACG